MNQWWNDIWNRSYMNCGYEIKWSYDPRSYERNLRNCVEKPEKFRTSTGFEPVTSRYRYDDLTNWAMKPLTLGAGHLWVLMFLWGMNQWWNDIWLTNRFHVAVRLFSNRSQMTSKCGKNKKVAHEAIAECVTDVLTTFWRLLWSVTEQTHGNMESICFI